MTAQLLISAVSLIITVLSVLMTARKNAEQSAMQTGEILEKLRTIETDQKKTAAQVEKNRSAIENLNSRVSNIEGRIGA